MPLPDGPGHLDPRALGARSASPFGPWTNDHLVALLLANGVGVAAMVAGWWVSHTATTLSDQVAWANLALVGLLFAGAADGLWLARGRQAVRRAQQVTVARIPEVLGTGPAPRRQADVDRHVGPAGSNGHRRNGAGRPAPAAPGALVATPEMTRFHHPGCLLVEGKPADASSRTAHERAGRVPCEVCRP